MSARAAMLKQPLVGDAVARLNAWLATAAPGDRLAYAQGYSLGETPAVIAARMLFDEGEVDLVQARSERKPGFDYFVVRRASVCPRNHFGFGAKPSAADRGQPRRVAMRLEDEDIEVMAVLMRAATKGRPCPTNAHIAASVGLRNPDAAAYRLRRLTEAGQIRIAATAPDKRVVTIVKSGLSTGVRE